MANLFYVMDIERREELLKANPPLLAEAAKPVLERAYHTVGPLHAAVSIRRGSSSGDVDMLLIVYLLIA